MQRFRKAPSKKKKRKQKLKPNEYRDPLGNIMTVHPPGCTCGSSVTRC
jgi:hypothetical protein